MKFWWTIRGGFWRLYQREEGDKFSRSRTGSGKRGGLNHKSVVSGQRSIVPVNAGHVQPRGPELGRHGWGHHTSNLQVDLERSVSTLMAHKDPGTHHASVNPRAALRRNYKMLRKFARSCFSLSVSPILKRRSWKSTSSVRSPAEPLAK